MEELRSVETEMEHLLTFINDADSRVYAFWDAVLNRNDELLKLIHDTPLTVEEWKRQRQLYLKPGRCSPEYIGAYATSQR